MGFCKFSSQSVISNKTEIDNIFINDFLPYAPENAVKVYLYGLYKCNNANAYDNSLESFSKVLKIPEEEILEIYEYWESEGLIQVLNTLPIEIRYMPIKNVVANTKKFNTSKYGDFNSKAQEIIEGRMISPNEYSEYYDTLETFHIEPEALLMVMKYCVNLKGANVGYNYILTVAKNWAYDNVRTVADVEDRLISYEQYSDNVKLLLKAMGLKKVGGIEEKEMYLKWTKELDFSFDTIIAVVNLFKKPTIKMTFTNLDEKLLKYYEMKLMTIEEITEFEKNKTQMYDTAKKIAKALGLYYENYDSIVETYISKWLTLGFSEEAIENIAKYCFKNSLRRFEDMNNVILKFYKLGLLSIQSLQQYFTDILSEDEKIKELLLQLGADNRSVNSYDRDFYKNWTNNWGISSELIFYGASLAAGKAQPMRYLNGILAKWHQNKVETIEDAKKNSIEILQQRENKKPEANIKTREYTKEELGALFDSLEEVEI
jgi:DnaD/phage-associated family protein